MSKTKVFVIMPFTDEFFESYEMIKEHLTHIQTQYILMMFYVVSKELMKAYIFLYVLMQTLIL